MPIGAPGEQFAEIAENRHKWNQRKNEGNAMCKVSVIIPIYNAEKYLRACLDSAVNQTLKEIEIICIDDGSADNSAAIAAEYMERYDNIRLIRQENGGPSKARNAGLDLATGEYICFLDSDDTLELQAVEKLYRTAACEALDILHFNAKVQCSTGELTEARTDATGYFGRTGNYSGVCTGQTMLTRLHAEKKVLASVCIQLFRRGFLEENGFRFYPGILHEDNLFSFRCAMCAQRVDYIPDELYIRRVRENSITTCQKSIRHLEGCLVCYYEALEFLQEIQLQEGVAENIFDYLYRTLFKGAYRIWMQLTPEEREKPLLCGVPAVEQLLYTLRNEAEEKDKMQQKHTLLTEKLRTTQTKLKKLEEKERKRPAQRIKRLLRAVKERGLGYTLRKVATKVSQVFAALMSRCV